MNRIISKDRLAEGIVDLRVEAPVIARKRKAGQFILLRIDETGERIPLTIVDSNPEEGSIRLIIQEVGKTTYSLGELEAGDSIKDIAGPLGKATHIENFGTVVCIGGGIGVAPVYPIAAAMKEAGNRVISIIGARNHDLMIMEEDMKKVSDRLVVATDDGSYGIHGFVTDALQSLIDEGLKIDLVVAIGPVPMMKFTSLLAKKNNLPTIVSLNSVMVDGTGMCGGCRVSVGGKSKFVCVDGPEFDGHEVDYDELTMRQSAYHDMEKEAMDIYHKCKIGRDGEDK
ncbi:MAG: sulfide/dihydroorotate dehydrogenase-like FAD/NAD-binding protein [Candidatus Electryonea clarkiae]|nr:sulfide/dihydroorotate dehydrogenase-like FAD/NAD-binding protein [Candidatus Electryonea clarkiae]MDP8288287.1 sulfide/dihydroorotate dehydrogenase-like FAD/NAD-binding protein [Candidatus Electryonea clarkiae]